MKKLVLIFAAGALVLTAACGGDDESAGASNGGDSGGGGTVTVTAANMAFDPSEVTASAGDTIELANDDDVPHTLTAEDAGIDEEAAASSSASISLEGVEAGEYEFICKIHPDMKGTLTIE